jgi:histidinol-phosphate phosphatase family protein
MHNYAVILAGGKGERMLPITEFQPKALVPVLGIPMIKLQIDQLERLGISKIFILTGHFGEDIQSYIDSQTFNIEIECLQSEPSFEPGERLVKYLSKLPKEFLLLYCDNFIPDDEVILSQINSDSELSMVLQHRDSGNIQLRDNRSCVYIQRDRDSNSPYVELGYISIKSENFREILIETLDLNLSFKLFSEQNRMTYIILNSDYASISDFQRYIRQGLQGKIIVLDRDGILNKKMPPRKYLSSFNELVYEKQFIKIFEILGGMGYSFVIASNQPGIATGEVSKDFLSKLHRKMTVDLRAYGVNILAFYVCEHHWDENCLCRKPQPGLLNQIASDFDLKASSTYFVGDEDKDLQAGHAAGMKSVLFPDDYFLASFT